MIMTFRLTNPNCKKYNETDVENACDSVSNECVVTSRKNKTKIEYYNVARAFDIETSSIYQDEQKYAFMYVWQFGLNGCVFVGRTWDEFINALEIIKNKLGITIEKRLIIYVHNLTFEFQFIRKHFKWDKVFSLSEREVVKAVTESGFEFRCSYLLSGYSLAKIGEHLLKYKVEKMSGDLDYSLVRNEKTKLSFKEWKYCYNDVLVLNAYIQEKIETDGNITKIPLTKTGYVRNYVRLKCLPKGKTNAKEYYSYSKFMQNFPIEPDEYSQLKQAYQGGFTHANAYEVDKVLENIASFDFTSSYPRVMLSEKYPMHTPKLISIDSLKTFNYYIHNYCCLFDIKIKNLRPKVLQENIISLSKCYNIVNYRNNNGRIVSAELLETTLTEQDYFNICDFYDFDSISVGRFRAYQRYYLPKPILESVLTFYEDKTKLKNVVGYESEYLSAKENVNSIYGMMVTDIVRDEIEYTETDEWKTIGADIKESILKYNDSRSRFTHYAWGVWVTAYARRNLMRGIIAMGTDYCYSDTDSLKVKNYEKHLEYINSYNKEIDLKIKKCLTARGLDFERSRPKDIKGIEHPLGRWDFESVYEKFKTLGAKRYAVIDNDKFKITVAGLGKTRGAQYLTELAKKEDSSPFDYFNDNLCVPKGKTGKNTHTYLDFEQNGIVTDYQGNTCEFHELSSVHIEPCEYNLSLASHFIDYLKGIKEKSVIL